MDEREQTRQAVAKKRAELLERLDTGYWSAADSAILDWLDLWLADLEAPP